MTKLATNVAHALFKASAAIGLLIIPSGVGYIYYSGATEFEQKTGGVLILIDIVPALLLLMFSLSP